MVTGQPAINEKNAQEGRKDVLLGQGQRRGLAKHDTWADSRRLTKQNAQPPFFPPPAKSVRTVCNMFSLLFLAHARCHRPARWQRAARAAPLLLLGAAPASIDACSRAPPPPDGHRGVDEVGATATLRLREGGTLSALSSSSACARAARWSAERMALAAAAPSALQPLRLTFGVLASPAVAA